jgi:hypothetical protein
LAATSKDHSDERKTVKHRFHSTIALVESSTSDHYSKPHKSSLVMKSRSSKAHKSDNIDILEAKPKSSKDPSRPLDSDLTFEKKSSQSTKVRSSTDKAKGSDRSKQEVANAKVSSSLPSKRHHSDEMTV